MSGRPASAAFGGLHSRVAQYYAGKIAKHGPVPFGVDWSCAPTQELRFVQLLKVCDFGCAFSLNDLGCGYGALRCFMRRRWPAAQVDYLGIDMVPAMIDAARRLERDSDGARFVVGSTCERLADYSVASGIFNVKLDRPLEEWIGFVRATLGDLCAASRRGFAVNFLACLDPGVDAIPELYRTAPGAWADYCEEELGTRVEVLAKYGMREFTLLARK